MRKTSGQGPNRAGLVVILSRGNWEPVKNFKKESDMVKFEFLEMEFGLEGGKEEARRLGKRPLRLSRDRWSLTSVVVPRRRGVDSSRYIRK